MPGMTAAWNRFAVAQASTRRPAPSRSADAAVVGAYEEFARIAGAVLGMDAESTSEGLATIERQLSAGRRLAVGCDPLVAARDRAAWKLLAAGYSASEIEDILTGRLERAEIDRARRLLMAGYGRRAAEYLEAAASRHAPSMRAPGRSLETPAPARLRRRRRCSRTPTRARRLHRGPSRSRRPLPARRHQNLPHDADVVTSVTSSQAGSATDVRLSVRQPLSRALAPRGMDVASVLASPDASRLGEPQMLVPTETNAGPGARFARRLHSFR